jgi:hypothetical protein
MRIECSAYTIQDIVQLVRLDLRVDLRTMVHVVTDRILECGWFHMMVGRGDFLEGLTSEEELGDRPHRNPRPTDARASSAHTVRLHHMRVLAGQRFGGRSRYGCHGSLSGMSDK